MSPETVPTAVTAYFNALQTMNPESWVENFSEDAVIYDPVGNPPNKAKENYQQFFGLLSMAFAKLEISQDCVRAGGNSVAVKWTMRGLGKNGKEGVAEGISIFELSETGKIDKVSSYWDDRAMMAQIRG
ncbi:MAG: nuclear transport factor 2 family protein [Oscillatoriaceae cyanobacterium Prado104]|jgi:steroid delta-isomerase|nr:nuclear transport factor 2 family protein [Oscillatoriaceae cyanobacterium Prado104]